MLIAAMMPLLAAAQAQITTKKIKISDFPEKTTKVVLTGNALYDAVLKEEIAARWRIAPYEFCTLQEFNELKGKNNYYFLLTTKGQFKTEGEPGLQFLTLVKGGEAAENGINQMLEIVSLPIASADDPSGRELTYFPHTGVCQQKIRLVGIAANALPGAFRRRFFQYPKGQQCFIFIGGFFVLQKLSGRQYFLRKT